MNVKTKLKRIAKKLPLLPSLAASLGYGGARLKALKSLPKNGVGAEIGVHLGDFSHLILDIAQPKKLYLIDPWKAFQSEEYQESWYGQSTPQSAMDERHQGVCSRFQSRIQQGQVEVLRQFSNTALSSLADESLDFVYIDGDHTYEGAKQDLELSFAKLKKGGLMTGDDYGPGDWWQGGVKKAVDEFGWNSGVKLLWIENTQFVLQKI